MDTAIQYQENLDKFAKALGADVVVKGRKFDKVVQNTGAQKATCFFVDRNSHVIYGAKSAMQYNPRRQFGTLQTVEQFDWSSANPTPIPGTVAERDFNHREAEIAKQYRKRGRPRKVKP